MRRWSYVAAVSIAFVLVISLAGASDNKESFGVQQTPSQMSDVSLLPRLIADTLNVDVLNQAEENVKAEVTVRVISEDDFDLDVILRGFENRFLKLERRLLDREASTINWWLNFVIGFLTVFMTALLVGFAFVGLGAKQTLDEIKREATRHLHEIVKHEQIARDKVEAFPNAEDAHKEPDKAKEKSREIADNPNASVLEKAVAAAYDLQTKNKIEEAIEKWRSIAVTAEGIEPEMAAQAWFSVGYLLQGQSDLQDDDDKQLKLAIEAYDKSLEIEPEHLGALNNRGDAKNGLLNFDDAITDFDEAIRIDSRHADFYGNRGHAKRGKGEFSAAFVDFLQAVNLAPLNAAHLVNLANVRKEMGDLDGAIIDIDAAIRIEPHNAAFYSNRAAYKTGNEDFEGAEVDLKKAISLDPGNEIFEANLVALNNKRDEVGESNRGD